MFAKLLKHEWRNCRQVLGVLCTITLCSGLMMGLSGIYLTWTEGRKSYVLATLLLLLAALAIGICAAGGFFYLLWRFYQSRFTDEGYLTFTLPVNNHQQLLAAFLNILRGGLLVFLATLGAFALMGLSYILVFFPRDVNWGSLLQAAARYVPELLNTIPWADLLKLLVFALSNLLALVVKLLLCITVGAVLARKHKLLTAVAVYFGIEMVQTWGVFAYSLSTGFDIWKYGIPVNLLIIVAGYFAMYWLTSRKLNLT